MLWALVVLGSCFGHEARAIDACEPAIAHVASLEGAVEMRHARETVWQPVRLGTPLCPGDSLRTGDRSRAVIRFSPDTTFRLDQGTTVSLQDPGPKERTLLELLRGAIHALTRTPRAFRVQTPYLNAAVEGTEFFVGVAPPVATVVLYEGRLRATNEAGAVALSPGEAATARAGEAPGRHRLVRPEDALQWALFYPAVVDPAAGSEDARLDAILRNAAGLFRQGRIAEAVAHIDAAGVEDARLLNRRVAMLLAVGRVDEAREDLDRAAALAPQSGESRALASIIALVRNDTQEALALARRATQLEPTVPASWLALSYAEQARFRIEDALAHAARAAELDPNSALVWARVSELRLSMGDMKGALDAARRAVALDPQLSRTHAVLGFAHLARFDAAQAEEAFDRAIELDQSDPLPRLGSGLARIRRGDLAGGRGDIEVAASLDPEQAVIRSYLGKAYFEEGRDALAAAQFDYARRLDPDDPTPWFLDALRKHAHNRPVEALADLHASMERNDNRAVYRSRLLLDSDLAARAVSLGRVYADLGFERSALAEAAISLGFDESNHSAHRFLADIYALLPRHEIARASELLRSQLLQPINLDPVQPRLSTPDLNMVGGAGLGLTGFEEFVSLFEREGLRLSAEGVVGNRGTWSDEVALSGLKGRFSYSLGQFHHETDGFRANNDIRHDIYSAFAQFAATPDFSVQFEARRRETAAGDLRLDFDPAAFSREDRTRVDQDIWRAGARWRLSPRSDVLFSLIGTERRERRTFFFPDLADAATSLTDQGYQLEVQHLLRGSGSHFLTTGASAYSIDARLRSAFDFTPALGELCSILECIDTQVQDFRRTRESLYTYLGVKPNDATLWTLGASFDRVKEGGFAQRVVNPKLGVQWRPSARLSIRAAAFRTVKSALVVGQTLEPTSVAGFNQFFDDENGTRATRFGIGVDVRPKPTLGAGLEWSRRQLRAPVIDLDTLRRDSWERRREEEWRAYLAWTPHRRWALYVGAEYERYRLLADVTGRDEPRRVETIGFPITIAYFDPGGPFARTRVTAVSHAVDRWAGSIVEEGRDRFTLVDVELGHRWPRRQAGVALQALNLFDKRFRYRNLDFQTSEPTTPRFAPSRTILFRFTARF